mgnify:CR=1 FL=1
MTIVLYKYTYYVNYGTPFWCFNTFWPICPLKCGIVGVRQSNIFLQPNQTVSWSCITMLVISSLLLWFTEDITNLGSTSDQSWLRVIEFNRFKNCKSMLFFAWWIKICACDKETIIETFRMTCSESCEIHLMVSMTAICWASILHLTCPYV